MYGEGEINATYISGVGKNKYVHKWVEAGCGTVGKQPVFGMRQHAGSVKAMTIVKAEDQAAIREAVDKSVEIHSMLYTDDHSGYKCVGGVFYGHESVKHSAKEYVNGMAHTNAVESIWSTIKRGFNGVYRNWSKQHCQQCINEFTFRLNEGNVEGGMQNRLDNLSKALADKTSIMRL